jgi:hypothetical protein
MLTQDEARARGWTIDGSTATRADGFTIEVASDTPTDALLANIAEAEGVGDQIGYGAPVDLTPPSRPGADLAAAIAAAVVSAVPGADGKAVEAAALAVLDPAEPAPVPVTGAIEGGPTL